MPWSKDNLPPSLKNKNWSEGQIEVFCKTANAMLEAGSPEGECIATGTKKAEEHAEKHNASQTQKPNFYYAKHMQPGVCKYAKEMVLVDVDALQAMIRTGSGIPVFIDHKVGIPMSEQKEKAAGYVTESFYNELDGWAWFKIMAIDDDIRVAVSNGWSVSNAYRPMQFGTSGTKNNVAYDREIVGAEFTHLAIVPNPRYEDACIMTPEEFKVYQDNRKAKLEELHNSKSEPTKGTPMLKLFKNKREEVSAVDAETIVEFQNDKGETQSKTVADMVKELLNAKKNSDDKELENQVVDVDGEKMTVKELTNRYCKMNQKRNEDEKKMKEEEEKKNAEEKAKKDEEEKKNAEEAEKKKKEEDEKTNGKGFYETLLNAKDVADTNKVHVVETPASMISRGQSRYGSAALKGQ